MNAGATAPSRGSTGGTAGDTVSVCIPVYNGERFLRECLDSVLSQTRRADEIIVVDDCSKDASAAIVAEYRARDDRIRYFRNDVNLGLVGNWNRCVQHAASTWIKFVFQDDVVEPNCLARMIAVVDDATDVVGCRREFIFDEPPSDELLAFYRNNQALIDDVFHRGPRLSAAQCQAIALDRFGENFLGEPSSVLLRRTCFERFGVFRDGLVMSCDLEYWLRVSIHSGATFVPKSLSRFRIHAGATSAENHGQRQFRMDALDKLLLLHDFARLPAYEPLRRHAADRKPPVDLDRRYRHRRQEVYATARWASIRPTDRTASLMDELQGCYRQLPFLAVSPFSNFLWRAGRKLAGRPST